jgi:hypothetical protein
LRVFPIIFPNSARAGSETGSNGTASPASQFGDFRPKSVSIE